MNHYQKFIEFHKDIKVLESVSSVLYWDQVTVMPRKGSSSRAMQMGTVARMAHEKQTSQEYLELLKKAEEECQENAETTDEVVNVKGLRWQYDRSNKLSGAFVEKLSHARVAGSQAWEKAKQEKNYALFKDKLKVLVELSQEAAEAYGYENTPYDALIENYEFGTSSEDLDRIFPPLQKELSSLVSDLKDKKIQNAPELGGVDYPIEGQKTLSLGVMEQLGFDLDNGFQTVSSHPFSMTVAPDDYRITTRFLLQEPMSSFYATIHEVGHSLYERGLPDKHWGTPRGSAVSHGFHESQSLFWENRIGRSRAFTDLWYSKFKELFPEQFKNSDKDGFYEKVVQVSPSYKRVEADEVCYCLHVILRYEIERDLINGKLAVDDIPAVWNQKMSDYLGVTPYDDVVGCLQDVHWSEGLFGYFPSYALGHLISAQFTEKMESDIGALDQHVSSKDFKVILNWLRDNIHKYGSTYEAKDLIEKLTSKPLSEKPFVTYLKKKYVL